MKATTVIVCLIVSLFGFTVQAQEMAKLSAAIPAKDLGISGGIVYSDGKNAVYYDYKTA